MSEFADATSTKLARFLAQSLGRSLHDRLRVDPGSPHLPALQTEEEQALVSLLDGTRTLEEVIVGAPLPPPRIQRLLQRLQVLGLLAVQPTAIAAEPPAAPPPPAAPTPIEAAAPEPLSASDRMAIRNEHARVLSASFYEMLGVAEGATHREVQHAYYALAKRYHPDVYFGRDLGDMDPLLFEIAQRHYEAYRTLRDTAGRRREYDAALPRDEAGEPAAPAARMGAGNLKRDAAEQFEKGIVYYQRNDYVKARPYLELACAFDPKNPVYREHRDRVRQMLGQDSDES